MNFISCFVLLAIIAHSAVQSSIWTSENVPCCIKHCCGVCEQNSIVNSVDVHVDDWTSTSPQAKPSKSSSTEPSSHTVKDILPEKHQNNIQAMNLTILKEVTAELIDRTIRRAISLFAAPTPRNRRSFVPK